MLDLIKRVVPFKKITDEASKALVDGWIWIVPVVEKIRVSSFFQRTALCGENDNSRRRYFIDEFNCFIYPTYLRAVKKATDYDF
jgi:hypothetical protein